MRVPFVRFAKSKIRLLVAPSLHRYMTRHAVPSAAAADCVVLLAD